MTLRASNSLAAGTLALGAVLWCAGAASAQITPGVKITAIEGVSGDQFGFAVAISGNRAIAGTIYDDDLGFDAGAAYVYNATTGEEMLKLRASDGGAEDFFGTSVSINNNWAIVGAPRDDDSGTNAGAAYLFDVNSGEELFKIKADDGEANDWFGRSVALNGGRALVGTRSETIDGLNSGSAYLFNAWSGAQMFKFTPADGVSADEFGFSVDIHQNIAIVGAFTDDEGGADAGAAYLFDATTGDQLFKLTALDADPGDWFGYSVSISNGTAIVGARGDDESGFNAGAAYLFDVATGMQIAKLTCDDAEPHDFFGHDVTISGNYALVGAHGDDDYGFTSGSAYLFDVHSGKELAKIHPGDVEAGDQFGISTAMSQYGVIVGANLDDDMGDNSGSAYLFELARVPGDADGDADVDLDDFDILTANFYQAVVGGALKGDFDGDGFVDMNDYAILAAHMGFGGSGELADETIAVLPEPGTLTLLCAGTMMMRGRRG